MIEPLDRSRRDSTPFQFTTRQLRGLIDSNHLLIRIDKQLNFAKLVGPLVDPYCPDFAGPPFIPRQRCAPVMAPASPPCAWPPPPLPRPMSGPDMNRPAGTRACAPL